MSVNTSEEYLDELLQAIEPIIYMNEPVPEPKVETEPVVEKTEVSENISDIFMGNSLQESSLAETEELPMSENENGLADLMQTETIPEEDVSMNDLLASLTAESESIEGIEEEGELPDIDAMLKAAADTADSMSGTSTSHDEDVRALLQQFTDDEDLSDIGDILERNDNSEAVDEAMLETPEVEVFRLEEENPEAVEEKKESKGIFGFLKKKKDKKRKEKKAETESLEPQESESASEILEIGDASGEGALEEVSQGSMEELLPEGSFDDLAGIDLFGLETVGEIDGESGAGNADLSEMSLDNIFAEGDMTDIDQLLSAGSFGEEGLQIEDSDGKIASIEEGASGKKKKSDKKESFLTKILTLLTEEDEDETKKNAVPEADATGVTDENVAILSELSKEDKKKAKKEKKEQKKKEKEEKKKGKAVTEDESGEDDGEGNDSDKKGKKEKKKKVKKEKPRKVVDIDEKPPKKLSRKKVSIIFAFCFTILAVILIMQTVLLDLSNVKEARKAFDNADYETCYANLYGVERSEEEEEIFQKSYIILAVQRKWESYQNLRQMDMEVEALDALFEGVRVYRSVEEKAESLRIADRITDTYRMIYDELKNYGLSEADIEEILAYESKVSYTKRLNSIVYGTPFEMYTTESEEVQEEIVEEPKPLEDVLPQEEDFLPEDTSLIHEMNQTEPIIENQVEAPEDATLQEKLPSVEEQGNTVVVGSAPVDINGNSNEVQNMGGVNVGNGDTNISATIDANGAVVGGF